MFVKRIVLFVVAILAAFYLAGCGGSSAPIGVSVTAASTTIDGGDSETVTATITNGGTAPQVNFTATAGTISGVTSGATITVTYTAPAATATAQTITITATSAQDSTKTGSVTVTVPAAPAITTTSTNLAGAVGSAYSVTLAASGGISPYTWSTTNLPACFKLSAAGVLTTATGTAPTATCAGTTAVAFKVTDSGTATALTATSTLNVTIAAAPPITLPGTVAAATAGVAYSANVTGSGGAGALTYSVTVGAAAFTAAGFTLNTATGAITGTPTTVGTVGFSVQAADGFGDTSASQGYTLTVNPGTATHFAVTAIGSTTVTAGGSVSYQVTALDVDGNTATGYAGTVKITSSDPQALFPGPTTLTSGTGTNFVQLETAGTQTITVTDTVTSSITGTLSGITVNPGGAYKLVVTAPSTATAGTAFSVTVTAKDLYGNTATGYAGTVHFTTTDTGSVTLPADYTFSGGDAGVHVFTSGADLVTAGSQTITAINTVGAVHAGTSGTITVSGGPATSLTVSSPSAVTSGTAFSVTVTAKDQYGNTASGYTGTVHFTTTDTGAATLPANYTFTGTDSGVHVFTTATLATVGVQTVTATDTATGSITGTSGAITVSPGAATTLIVSPITAPPYTAGTSASIRIIAKDANGNIATGYTGTVKFTSSDSQAVLPANTLLASGLGTVSVTFKTSGSQTLTATDTVTASITGISNALTVTAAAASKLVVTAPSAATTSVAFSLTVTAQDPYGNTATGYAGTVHFTSTDVGGGVVLPANYTFVGGDAGVHVFANSATLKTNGTQTITATDTVTSSITGTSGSISVSTALIVSTSSLNPLDVGQAATQTLTASGGSGNSANYSWTWTAQAGSSIPAGLSLGTNGAITGSPTTAGTYNVTVKVVDSGTSTNTTANLSITIYAALSLPVSTSLPAGYTGVAYTGGIAGSGGSGLPNVALSITSALSPSNGTLVAGVIGYSLSITGTATNATPESITVKLTDSTTGNSISQTYTFTISTPTPMSLPTPNPASLPSATVTQSYTGTINASGGVGPYTWTINGTTVTSGGISLGNGLTATSTGTNTLNISGTPTTTTTVTLTNVKVADSENTPSTATNTYTITVNPNGYTVSGTITLNNLCTSGVAAPGVTVTLATSPGGTVVNTTVTDSNGNYSFTTVANGSYTITPSITGPSSAFYPASQTTTVSSGNQTAKNFGAALGYTVSGTVSYAGANTGQVYLTLNNPNCTGSTPGTSLSAAGTYTIRGVPPGTYTLQAWMDTLGNGAQNTSNPTGSTANVTLSNANLTGQNITLSDNTPTSVPSSNPGIGAVTPTDLGAVISFQAVTTSVNGNKVEAATSYDVQFSTSSTFATGTTVNFKAAGTNVNIWFLNNGTSGVTGSPFVNGQIYYFEARSRNAVGHTSGWTVFGGGTPTGVTIGASTTGNMITGSITLPAGTTITSGAPLYAGYYNQSSNTAYAARIAAPIVGANAFTLYVPTDANQDYIFYGVLDQNNDGLIDAGDVTNVHANNSTGIAITGNLTNQTLTLPSTNSVGTVGSQFYQVTTSSGTSTGYSLNLNVRESDKLPVAVTLTSGANAINPLDIAVCTTCGTTQFQYSLSLNNVVPTVGQTYNFTVTYSDGTTGTVTGTVTAFGSTGAIVGSSDLATNLAPNGTSSISTTPTFTWTYPLNASNYTYQFYLQDNSGNQLWQIPGNNSNSNGFPSTVTQIVWNTDPTGGGSTPTVGSLTLGTTYNWSIQVQDSNSNSAQTQTYYIP